MVRVRAFLVGMVVVRTEVMTSLTVERMVFVKTLVGVLTLMTVDVVVTVTWVPLTENDLK
jgi:hypothetical protein